MTKKYGGYGGNKEQDAPSSTRAPGSWNNSESFRQKSLGQWPRVLTGASTSPGNIVYAISSGVVHDLQDNNTFLVPSGQLVSRSTFSALFSKIGTTFGIGDGSTTFGLPKLNADYEQCIKCTTVSGLSPSDLVGSGVVPTHTHTLRAGATYTAQSFAPQSTTNNGSQNVGYTLNTSFDGDPAGNAPIRKYLSPLISTEFQTQPPGTIFPLLLGSILNVASSLPANTVIASGQELSRSTYSTLFTLTGTEYGSGDGSTTFNVPDLRGIFISNPYPDLSLASGSVTYSGIFAEHRHSVASVYNRLQQSNPGGTTNYTSTQATPATTNCSLTGTESRPNNFSVVYCLVIS